jgi:predicted Zn-dependent peptidase
LFQVVREKHGLAYSVHSSMHLFDETGALVVSAGLERARTDKALQLIFGEIARMTDRPGGRPRTATRKRLRHRSVGNRPRKYHQSDDVDRREQHLVRRLIQPAEVMQRIEAVTEKDILNLAREIFLPKRTSVAMVTPNEPDPQERQIRAAVDLLR